MLLAVVLYPLYPGLEVCCLANGGEEQCDSHTLLLLPRSDRWAMIMMIRTSATELLLAGKNLRPSADTTPLLGIIDCHNG